MHVNGFKVSLLAIALTTTVSCGVKKETAKVTGAASKVSSLNSTISATSGVVADGSTTSTITIVFLDADKAPVQGVIPEYTVAGTGNVLSACSETDETGTSTCTFTSTVAETKAILLTYPVEKQGNDISFVAGTAAKLCFRAQGSGGLAGAIWSTQPEIGIGDSNCNLITTATDTVTLALTSGTGVLLGTKTVAAVGGIAKFTDLSMTDGKSPVFRNSTYWRNCRCRVGAATRR